MTAACACGEADCIFFAADYPFCVACEEHHRPPVAEFATDACPVDEMVARLYGAN